MTPTPTPLPTGTPTPVPVEPLPQALSVDRKLFIGYQGWFACPGDGSPVDGWVHWFHAETQRPNANNVTVDMWPDTSEIATEDLCATPFPLPDGSPAYLYSNYNYNVVRTHFLWMEQYGIHGAFLQRFLAPLKDRRYIGLLNRSARNVLRAAHAHDRTFAIMYDISGHSQATLVGDLKRDWQFLVDWLDITQSPNYQRHRGKPVLGIWGLGFTDRPGTPEQAAELISWLKSDAEPKYRVTLFGGVPTQWRALSGDAKQDPKWTEIYRSFDIVSPWAVGRYSDAVEADRFKQQIIEPDLQYTASHGVAYSPVVFPGFSWHNLKGAGPNQIPRDCGRFFWRQAYNAISARAEMLYVAMFDEVDEGTAMYKLAPTTNELPAQGTFVPLDIDGCALPSDWYLILAGWAQRMLSGEVPLSPDLPVSP